MTQAVLDYEKIRKLRDEGWKLARIANELDTTKGAVSKALKKMGRAVTVAAIDAAPKYERKRDVATDHLLYLCDKARSELQWIEDSVPPSTTEDYRAWQDQKLKFAAEMRKLIAAIADVGYKLFQTEEVREILEIIDQEVGHESPECQKRIRNRIQQRRALRFPAQFD